MIHDVFIADHLHLDDRKILYGYSILCRQQCICVKNMSKHNFNQNQKIIIVSRQTTEREGNHCSLKSIYFKHALKILKLFKHIHIHTYV